MTEKEALAILNLEEASENEIIDAFELICFQEKQSLYKDPILPKIVDARIKKITRIGEALDFLLKNGQEKNEVITFSLDDLNHSDWKLFFHHYEQNKALLRKELANAFSAKGIVRIMDQMKHNEIMYASFLVRNVQINDVQEVKASMQMPIIEIVAELFSYLEQGVIDNSFASLNKLDKINTSFKLHLEVSRVKKLLNE